MNALERSVGKSLNSLFRMAIIAGVETAVRLHVRRGDDLDARDGNGMTPLMLAASRNKGAICTLLLSSGADPALVDPSGRDALAVARAAGAVDAVSVLEPFARKAGEEVPEPVEGAPKGETGVNPDVMLDTDLRNVARVAVLGLDDGDYAFDLSGWEVEEDGPAPEDDRTLSETARSVHGVISAHVPIDTSEDWGDFDAFLPERAVPLPKVGDEEGREGIRRTLRMALREGSVPEQDIVALSENEDGTSNESGEALLRLVLGDMGAETDERLDLEDPSSTWDEREADEDEVSEALAFLEDVGSGRNEPMRIYIREMRGGRLLTADEEISLARDMDQGVASALDALAAWPEGIATFMVAAEKVRSGEIEVESVSEGCEDEQRDFSTGTAQIPSDESEEEGNGFDLPPVTREFLDKAGSVRVLARNVGRGGQEERLLRNALQAARLSSAFLVGMANTSRADCSGAAERFRMAVARYTAARERMTVSNLRLVISVVKRYQGLGLPLEDLVQEGNIGLMKAVERYDWRKGFRFSTYATWWIRQQATRAVADKGKTIRTPVHVHDTMLRIAREADESERLTGRIPSVEVLAGRLCIPAKKVSTLMARMEEPVPLHEPDASGEAPSDSLIDESVSADPSAQADRVALIAALERMLLELDPRQAEVIAFRFGLDGGDQRTLEETGGHYGVTRERIRQIEASALKKLAHPIRSDILRDFLEGSAVASRRYAVPLEETLDEALVPQPKGRPRKSFVVDSDVPPVERQSMGGTDRLVERVRATGAFVEDGRSNGGEIVVRLRWEGTQTRALIRALLNHGFRPYPGMEYRK